MSSRSSDQLCCTIGDSTRGLIVLHRNFVQGGAVLGGYNPLGFDGYGEQLTAGPGAPLMCGLCCSMCWSMNSRACSSALSTHRTSVAWQ
jgi:hypothetical protein